MVGISSVLLIGRLKTVRAAHAQQFLRSSPPQTLKQERTQRDYLFQPEVRV